MALNYQFQDKFLEPDPRFKSKLASKFINWMRTREKPAS